MKQKVTETHPQSGPVKRPSLAGAKPLKLTTLTTLSAVFPKAQRSQSEAKKEAEIEASPKPTQIGNKRTLNKIKNKTTKN